MRFLRTIGVRFGRQALSSTVLALLMSCGGGDDPPTTTESGRSSAAGRQQALSFFPPVGIPTDAHVKGMWSPVYPWPLIAVHTVVLPDGRVMSYGSDLVGLQTGHTNYDVWDSTGAPNAGHLTLPNGSGTDIFCSSQLLLPQSGKVFIAGGDVWLGTQTRNGPNNNSNLFDGTTNTLTRGINMQRARWYSTSITLLNGETYIQGGNGGGDRPEIRGLDGTFRLMDGIDTSLLDTFFPRNFVAPDGRVFGYDAESGQMYYVNASGGGSMSLVGSFNVGVSGAWQSSAAMYRPGRILQIGGNSNGAYTIDITGGTPVVTQTNSMSSRRAWVNATILADGKVVATSGSAVPNEAVSPNNIAEIWNPTTGQWLQGAVAQKMRLYHSNAILLPDASVLVSGGGAGNVVLEDDPNKNNLNAEIYYPPYLFAAGGVRAVRPGIATAPAWIDIGKTFAVELAGPTSISRVTLIKTGSVSHSFNAEQRFLELPFKATGSQVTIQAPTRAGEAPPGYYMLFVFDAAGTPSVAKILRMGVAADPNPAITPMLADPGSQSSTVGTAVDLSLIASDPNGDTLTFDAADLPPGLSLGTTSGRITGTPTTSGAYNTVLAVSDGINSVARTILWNVQAGQPLVLATPPAPSFIEANGTATYTASATGGAGLRYQWNFGDGSPTTAWSASPSVTHAYANGGTYTVTVTVTDNSGSVISRSFTQAVYLPTTAAPPTASTNVLVEKVGTNSSRLWVVNQDNDSVSAFDAKTLVKLGEVAVGVAGGSPRTLALASNGLLWVSNKQVASISVIDPATRTVVRTIALPHGSQPFGIVMSPVGNVAYVALEGGGAVLKFNSATFAQQGSVAVGMNVRHLSVSADGANLYASRFITPPLPGESTALVRPSATAGAEVLQIATSSLNVVRTIVLRHGEKFDAENQGRGIPNYLGAAVISPDGTQAWVQSKQDNVKRGSLRDGMALNFQNTVRAISSRIALGNNSEDLNARVDHDDSSVASAAVFDSRGVYVFVALETSREVAVVNAFSGAQLFRIDVGRAPQGLALSADGKRLFVSNFMDRSVSVLDLGPLLDRGVYQAPLLASLPAVATEKLTPPVLNGKQLFYDARDPRLARDRYMSCASCHNDGRSDGRVWDLTGQGEGLRRTTPLRGKGKQKGHGFLHWSANFDEVQDFEGQIRSLAGGTGLMSDALFFAGTTSEPLGSPKVGKSADLDALAAYLASLTLHDTSPILTTGTPYTQGQNLFKSLNCAACHGGEAFSSSGNATLRNIGTLKTSSGKRLFGALTGIDPPTLRGVWSQSAFLHDGSALSLQAAVRAHNNVSIGDADLNTLVGYLKTIAGEEITAPILPGSGTGLLGSYYANSTFSGTPAYTRTEVLDFTWGPASPGAPLGSDNWSVRWSGQIEAPSTGTYVLQVQADDGIKLTVNGQVLIDQLGAKSGTVTTTFAPIALVAGQRYPVVVEHQDQAGDSTLKLRWMPPGSPNYYAAIPLERLYPPQTGGVGVGLRGQYFANLSFTGAPAYTRNERVDFTWGSASPGAPLDVNGWSVRWSGKVEAPATGNYVLQVIADDGVRLTVNGQVLIDRLGASNGNVTTTLPPMALVAGQRYAVTLEHQDASGASTTKLRWLPPGTSTYYTAIPTASLYPQ